MKQFTIRLKGGAGSGHHGHKGRPGFVGGSAPSDSQASVNLEGNTMPIPTGAKPPAPIGSSEAAKADMKYLDADGSLTPEGRKVLGIKERNPDPKALFRIETPEYHAFVEDLVSKHNKSIDEGIAKGYRDRGKRYAPISFNTHEEADLFLQEYTGQISDGKYENSNGTNWETFVDLKVVIDPTKPTTFPAFRHISMSFRDLDWLASADHASHYDGDDTDVRSTFSWVSDKKLHDYARSIGSAMNANNKAEYERWHPR